MSAVGISSLQAGEDVKREFGTCNIKNYIDPFWGGKHVRILPIVLNPGKVNLIKSIDLIKTHKNVLAVKMFGGEGEEITQEMFGSINRFLLKIHLAAQSKNGIIEGVNFANKTFQVIDEFDTNMILFKFDKNIIVGLS